MNQIRGLQDVTVSGNVHYDTASERVFADLDLKWRDDSAVFYNLRGCRI